MLGTECHPDDCNYTLSQKSWGSWPGAMHTAGRFWLTGDCSRANPPPIQVFTAAMHVLRLLIASGLKKRATTR